MSLGFSYFIDLSMSLLSFVHPKSYPTKALFLLVGCLVLGFGVFMDVVMLPGECTVKAISSTWSTDFGKTKVAVDVTMSVTAAVVGLILYRALTGVREGTFVSALLVGFIARTFNKQVGPHIQNLLSVKCPADVPGEAH